MRFSLVSGMRDALLHALLQLYCMPAGERERYSDIRFSLVTPHLHVHSRFSQCYDMR